MIEDGLMFSEYGKGCLAINDIVDTLDVGSLDYFDLYPLVLGPLEKADQVTEALVIEALEKIENQ